MRIKKTSETRALAGKTVNAFSNSTTDAYSCDYINNITGTPIWINLYGNGAFSAKEITGSFSQYNKFAVVAFADTNNSAVFLRNIQKNSATNVTYGTAYSRTFTITDTKITIAEGKYEGNTNNQAVIPALIIGYK